MGCKDCKNKDDIKKQIYDSTKVVDSWIIWFALIWTGLAIYGLYSLIVKFL
jgi:hypothetical protein